MPSRFSSFATLLVMVVAAPAMAQYRADVLPKELEDIGITEKLNNRLPLDATFTDSEGNTVTLGDYFAGDKPVVLALVYYECPMLCTLGLNGLNDAARQLDWTPGEEYEIVTVSFNPAETHQLAAHKKASYVQAFGRPQAAKGWHFLVGNQTDVSRLAEAVGFGYKWNEDRREFMHASAIYVVTPDGRLSKYLYGVMYEPRTLRLSLVEASGGGIGSIGDHLTLLCSHYNPKEGTYAASAVKIMNLTAPGAAAAIGVVIIVLVVRGNRRHRAAEQAHHEAASQTDNG